MGEKIRSNIKDAIILTYADLQLIITYLNFHLSWKSSIKWRAFHSAEMSVWVKLASRQGEGRNVQGQWEKPQHRNEPQAAENALSCWWTSLFCWFFLHFSGYLSCNGLVALCDIESYGLEETSKIESSHNLAKCIPSPNHVLGAVSTHLTCLWGWGFHGFPGQCYNLANVWATHSAVFRDEMTFLSS